MLILADKLTGSIDSKSAQMPIDMISNLNKDWELLYLWLIIDLLQLVTVIGFYLSKIVKIFKELVICENIWGEFFNKILYVLALLWGVLEMYTKLTKSNAKK